MKMNSFRRAPRRGSALLAAMIVIVILTFAAAGVLSYSLTTYLNSKRQALLDRAKEIADSEMEYLFFCWKTALVSKKYSAVTISCYNTTTSTPNYNSPLVNTSVGLFATQICGVDMTTNETPFDVANQGTPGVADSTWTISRTVIFNPIAGTSDGSAEGLVAGSTQQTGHIYYFTAETSASVADPVLGTITFHSGHHFQYVSTSLYQFAVFYQGNLEIAAGGNMTISGPLSTNASAYIGSSPGYTLTLTDHAYYFEDYNGASDPLSGETQRLEGSGALNDPIYNPDPTSAAPSNQAAQRALQVAQLTSQSSFIGGVDVANDILTYPAAYSNLSGVADPNEVYRAVIAPDPLDSSGNLLPEDPVVQASRLYNSAALVITINQSAAGNPPTVHIGYVNPANPTDQTTLQAYDSTFGASLTGGASPIISSVRVPITDPREEVNGTPVNGVQMSTLDVGNLNTALTTSGGALATNAALATAYNGVVYVYDNTNNNSSAMNMPGNLNAIRIANATTTPAVNDANGNPIGFTVVSNNGVYVQGDFNTTQIMVNGTMANNPTAIMGDAVTALSQGWTPAESNLPYTGRQASPSTVVAANGVNPASTLPSSYTGMTINAAILTGNTPSTSGSGAYNSGGVQNLVRMIEDWYDPGNLTMELNGSLGQLFTSKYFAGHYTGNGVQAALANPNDHVYYQPKNRNFDYDTGFKDHTPAGSPTTTSFYRGDFFFW